MPRNAIELICKSLIRSASLLSWHAPRPHAMFEHSQRCTGAARVKLNGKTVLVTGGGRGIGLEFTRQLTALGNTVIMTGRNEATLEAAAQETGAEPMPGDVMSAKDQDRWIEEIKARHGRIDFLINNAGILLPYDFASDPDTLDKLEREIATNAAAPLTLTRRALPLLKISDAPAVLFISSAAAFVATAATPVYSGTKSLLHHSAQALRHQLAPLGISVFEAMPPVVDTDMGAGLKSDNFKKMAPEDLVRGILQGLRDDRPELLMGQARQVKWLSRIAPGFAFRQFSKTEFH
ncbi:MAG: SDR family NAD(P)-dependent oxidoreductase [Pseudomonadota bacterium]